MHLASVKIEWEVLMMKIVPNHLPKKLQSIHVEEYRKANKKEALSFQISNR